MKTQDTRPASTAVRGLLALMAAALVPAAASAQDYGAAVAAGMARMDSIIRQANQQANGIVQQRMQDPQVQAGYRQYVHQMQGQGRPAMDFPQYAYEWVRTRGFSAQGKAFAYNVERTNQIAEQNARDRVRQAESESAAAIQGWNNGFSRNSGEFGNQLMGNSTYHGPGGYQTVLPHTWQANTYQVHKGNRYAVDASGGYHVLGTDGYWYPLSR